MTRLFISILFLFTISFTAYSQNENNKPDGSRLEALKIAYLTKKLNLTPEEAQRFWPIYNKYSAEIHAARVEQREDKTSQIEKEEKTLRIRKKYNAAFSGAIGPEKTDTFFRSEKDFGNYVRKELMERRELRQQLNRQPR